MQIVLFRFGDLIFGTIGIKIIYYILILVLNFNLDYLLTMNILGIFILTCMCREKSSGRKSFLCKRDEEMSCVIENRAAENRFCAKETKR